MWAPLQIICLICQGIEESENSRATARDRTRVLGVGGGTNPTTALLASSVKAISYRATSPSSLFTKKNPRFFFDTFASHYDTSQAY